MIWILNYRARKNNKGYPIISTGRIASNGFFYPFFPHIPFFLKTVSLLKALIYFAI